MDIQAVIEQLNQVLEQRDALFPQRDPANSAAMWQGIVQFYTALMEKELPDWKLDEGLIQQTRKFAENAVFICGHMKSGTTLLANLLDGHPALLVMPGDSAMINRLKHPEALGGVIHFESKSSVFQGAHRFWDIYWLAYMVNPAGQKPFWLLGEDWHTYRDFLYYLAYWAQSMGFAGRGPFLAGVLAYYCANPKRPSKPRLWVEKTPDNEHKISEILALFPEARFIHITRQPLANAVSLKRLVDYRQWNTNAESIGYEIRRSLKAALHNQQTLGTGQYHILRYEDLITEPKEKMKDVADYLSIEVHENLFIPTINGLTAKSNTMFRDRRVDGEVLPDLQERWKNELDKTEMAVVSALTHRPATQLGYFDVPAYPFLLLQIQLKRLLVRCPQKIKAFLRRG